MPSYNVPTINKESSLVVKDMGTPASSDSHCTTKPMTRTLCSVMLR